MPSNVCSMPLSKRKAILIGGLDLLSPLDLEANPPTDATTLKQLMIGETVIDRVLRPAINRKFRVPCGKPAVSPGKLKSTATIADLVELI